MILAGVSFLVTFHPSERVKKSEAWGNGGFDGCPGAKKIRWPK
jgi:hypothetical protein